MQRMGWMRDAETKMHRVIWIDKNIRIRCTRQEYASDLIQRTMIIDLYKWICLEQGADNKMHETWCIERM